LCFASLWDGLGLHSGECPLALCPTPSTATEIQLPPEKAVAGKEFLQNEELKMLVLSKKFEVGVIPV
jgi:hypothetical protein